MARKQKKSNDGSNGSEPQFNKGDWIVHISHGIGKITRVEKKLVRGKKIPCYRVRTEDSVFWIPVDSDVTDRVRPVATPRKFKRVVKLLSEPGEKMAKMHKARRKRIERIANGEVTVRGEVVAVLMPEQMFNQLTQNS